MELNRRFLHHKNEKIKVIWSAKGACTQIVKMFLNHEDLLEEAIKYNPWVHNYRSQIYEKIQKKFSQDDVKYIHFTVSPYRRAVSSYLHLSKYNGLKRKIDEEDLKLNQELKNLFHKKIKKFIKYRKVLLYNKDKNILKIKNLEQDIINFLNLKKEYEKNEFLIYKNRNVINISFFDFLVLVKNNNLEKEEHYNIQTYFNYKNLDIEYFKMEEIENNYKLLKDKYNLNYKHFSSNHYIKKNNRKEFCGYTNYDDLKDNIPNHYKYFYNDKIKKLVEEIYEIDIKVLNYTWDEFLNTDI